MVLSNPESMVYKDRTPAAKSQALLDSPVFSLLSNGVRVSASFTEVLSKLALGHDLEFPALRPHQEHAWYAFLVQVAALVASRAGGQDRVRGAEAWRAALLDLAGASGADAWALMVPDPQRAAFFQNPAPLGNASDWPTIETPDGLDVLVAAKNHEVKQELMRDARPEHWVYALVTLQTMEGYSGAKNYGVLRMNGGYGSRPALGASPNLGWADRWHRDVAVWLEQRDRLTSDIYGYPESGGHALLWTLPWDGRQPACRLVDCDPFFLEVCRRVRLVEGKSGLVARRASSDAPFLAAAVRRGDTGDIWTPIEMDNDGTKALSVSGDGFSYQRLSRLLLRGDFLSKPALALRPEDGAEPLVLARVLARGQGQTDGFHERTLPIPASARPLFADPTAHAELAALAENRIARVAAAKRQVLHPALCALLQGAPSKLDLRDDRSGSWLQALERSVDQCFFPDLFAAMGQPAEERNRDWDATLWRFVRDQFSDAAETAPIPEARHFRAIAKAELLLRATARKHLDLAFPAPEAQKGAEE